jgi:hypothetical protein
LIAYIDPTGAALIVFCIIILCIAWLNTYVGLKHGTSTRRILTQLALMFAVIVVILFFVSARSLGVFFG